MESDGTVVAKKTYPWFYVCFLVAPYLCYLLLNVSFTGMGYSMISSSMYAAVAVGVFTIIEYWYFVLRKRDYADEPFYQDVLWSGRGVILLSMIFFGVCFLSQYVGSYILATFGDALYEDYLEVRNAEIQLYLVSSLAGAPLFEEAVFRGTGFAMMRKKIGAVPAAVLSSCLFGLAHMNVVQFVTAFFFGMLLAWVYEMTGKLRHCIFLHILYNLTVMSVVVQVPVFYYNSVSAVACFVILGCISVLLFAYRERLRPVFLRDEDPYEKYR